jgi:hypothetical protein
VRRAGELTPRLVPAVAAAIALAAAGCGDDAVPDRAATERMFLETCAPGGEEAEEEVCRCAFERLTEDLSDDELEDLDRRVRGGPETLPVEVTEAALACAAELLEPGG